MSEACLVARLITGRRHRDQGTCASALIRLSTAPSVGTKHFSKAAECVKGVAAHRS